MEEIDEELEQLHAMALPKKFRAEFEEFDDGSAEGYFEEEFESEILAEQTLRVLSQEDEDFEKGIDGNKVWVRFTGDKHTVAMSLLVEVLLRAIEDESDALEIVQLVSQNTLEGSFTRFVTEEEAMDRLKNPPMDADDVREKFIEEFGEEELQARVGDGLKKMEEGGELSMAYRLAKQNLNRMLEEGVIDEDDTLEQAIQKMFEYREKIAEEAREVEG